MKFRVVERQLANKWGHRFSVEVGTQIRQKVWWVLYKTVTVWNVLPDEVENREWSAKTFDEAAQCIQELKKQIPSYTEIV